uniref:Uncharacterized protein n=1 Tax=Anopheles coluzzii TaxID=1518534 RepID=A0A8W7PDJ9_ANOCL
MFRFFLLNGYAPPYQHELEVFDANNVIPLSQYHKDTLHYNWERYIHVQRKAFLDILPCNKSGPQPIVYNGAPQIPPPGGASNGPDSAFSVGVLLPEGESETTIQTQNQCIPLQNSDTERSQPVNNDAADAQVGAVVRVAYDKFVVSFLDSVRENDVPVIVEGPSDGENTDISTAVSSISDESVFPAKHCVSLLGDENAKNGSGQHGNLSRSAAVATLYAAMKKYLRVLKNEVQQGLLRLSCSHRTDGSLVINAEYITHQFEDYRSMEDKDATYAFNYYEKVEETLLASGRGDLLQRFEQILRNYDESENRVSVLYYQIEDLLGESFPQLVDMFLTFLLPGQAAEVGKFFEHFILTNMGDFLEKLNVFFAKQPSQIKKIHACLNELSNEPDVTMEQVKTKVLPLLKSSTLLTEWFLQLFPGERPPESPVCDYEHIGLKKHALNDSFDAGSVYEHVSYIETLPEVEEYSKGLNQHD